MTIGLLFWVLMVLSLVFGGWRWSVDSTARQYFGMSFLLWILLFLLGWAVFGFIIQGK